jgi:hypothetical protein
MIRRVKVTNNPAAGSAGSAVGIGITGSTVNGLITAVHLRRISAPTTADVIIREARNNPSKPILTVLNLSADGWYYPRTALNAISDGSAIVGPVDYQNVQDYIELRIEGANSGSTIEATIEWDDLRLPA